MKILKISLVLVILLLLIVGEGYLYASHGIKPQSGYAKFTLPKGESVNPLFSINVGPRGVKPVRWLLEQVADDFDQVNQVPEQMFKNALRDLQGVQLRVYDVDSNRQVFDMAIADSIASLKEKSWRTLATVREDDVKIAVLQYGEGVQIEGLSIMASTPDKALFLNLVGPLDAIASN